MKSETENYKSLVEDIRNQNQERLRQAQPPSNAEEDKLLEQFDDSSRKAVETIVNRKIKEIDAKYSTAIKQTMIEKDLLEFKVSAGDKDYAKFKQAVEAKMIEEQRSGRYTPPVVLYQQLRNEERAKKAERLEELEKNLRAFQKRGGQIDPTELNLPDEEDETPTHHSNPFNSFNTGGQPVRRTKATGKSFSEMTLEEKEADLAKRELSLRR